MMPVIRISEKTFERLKLYARPLEDSADDVVIRALDALEKLNGQYRAAKEPREQPEKLALPRKRKRGSKLPQKEFRAPLMNLLHQLGGRASVGDVRDRLEPIVAPKLGHDDYEQVSNGDPRWWNAVCWERSDLVKEGLLRADSERGVWELSQLGRDLLTRQRDQKTKD